MSKLIVEVCKIDKIEPHPNADKLDVATVKGWQTIIQKGQYQVGDLVIFVPPDAMLPPELIEAAGLDYLKKGNRVQVVKLRGFVSQGLLLPCITMEKVTWHPALQDFEIFEVPLNEGVDVAGYLNITKWEPPEAGSPGNAAGVKKIRKSNPYFDKYTDIQNIKHYPDVFEDGEEVVIMEKIHGANWRCGYLPLESHQNFWSNLLIQLKKLFGQKYEFVYGSHNVQLQWFNRKHCYYKTNIYYDMVEKYKILDIPELEDYIIYGEAYGKGVQDLTYGIEDVDLVVFDVKYKGKYLDYEALVQFVTKYNLKLAPILFKGKYQKELVGKLTKGASIVDANQIREGFVIKPLVEVFHPQLGRKILKSISEDYLTRKGSTTEFK